VNEGDDAAQAVAKLETPGNINQHADPGKDNGQNGLLGQVFADFGAYELDSADFVLTGAKLPGHGLFHLRLQLFGHGLVGADDDFIGADFLGDRVLDVDAVEGFADGVGRGDFGKLDLNYGAAREVNAEIQSAVQDDGQDADDDQRRGNARGDFHFSNKIKMCSRFDKFHSLLLCKDPAPKC